MAERPEISFVKPDMPTAGSVVVLVAEDMKLGAAGKRLDEALGGRLLRAAKASRFDGKALKTLHLLAPEGSKLDRITLIGIGDPEKLTAQDWMKLGGTIGGSAAGNGDMRVLLERPDDGAISAADATSLGLGVMLRTYSFDKYKTRKKNDDSPKPRKVSIGLPDYRAAQKAWSTGRAIADGVDFARDLVNEPANTLGPVEFADRLKVLTSLGVTIQVLDEKTMRKQKMGALLGVGQGSPRPPRIVVMRWKGGREKDKPVALIGKGVVFDSGGISIKPAAGMEDMKGDMGGAAAVVGAMHALAARKAKANVVGIVGLVENMVDGNAQRPGDVVTSMSGQTIEVINTDAEGRLVLADLMTYIQKTDQPVAMVGLATLTGAIIVALGNHHAGLFSNNDELSAALTTAGLESGEKVWRMPLGPEYDKLIDSKIADMKNTGGRYGGSITAAQFLQRFVEKDTPWAHLDVAGTAMGSPATETNQSWGSGYGVRLLDRFVADRYEQ